MAKLLNPGFTPSYVRDRGRIHAESSGQFLLGEKGRSDLPSDLHRQLGSEAASTILSLRHWLKMAWVNARRLAAKVIDLESGGNRSDLLLVHRSVGENPLSVDPHTVVPSFADIITEADPTIGCISTILGFPHIRGNRSLHLEVSNMSPDEPDVFSGSVAQLFTRHLCAGSWTTAAALADPPRVWSRDVRAPLAPPPGMVLEEALGVPLLPFSGGAFIDPSFLSTSALTKHSRTVTYAQGSG